MNKDVKKVLFSEEDIHQMSVNMGKQITEDYKNLVSDENPLMVIGLLKGCVPFLSELIKRIDLPLTFHFMQAKSYVGSKAGTLNITMDLKDDVKGKHLLIVEDIVDTGHTLSVVKDLLEQRGAASVKVATMLDKVDGRVVPFEANYVGFDCPNEFIIGYGLDFDERYRELPFIGVLKEEVYK